MDNNWKRYFNIAHKEARIGICLVLANFLWWFGFAYGLGSGQPSQYTYILGFPAWFFFSCIVGLIVMAILVTVVVTYCFTEIPFEEEDDQ
ncbi:YhdT family protein [Bacillus sp. 1P06AnD]|uniref:YhdT family protein n=1 Tax=Bacillus sp. 1P06AnD TaxID=3132208 RepID=UPI0039A1FA8F